ncbi:hypothetical protein VNO77_27091 [Canavalia gladiata]|uniref:Uncharacterized protein n=1 Tax=Canavalia gladiata TaxID=3824 RepID=A0AAN9KUR6_CANGL
MDQATEPKVIYTSTFDLTLAFWLFAYGSCPLAWRLYLWCIQCNLVGGCNKCNPHNSIWVTLPSSMANRCLNNSSSKAPMWPNLEPIHKAFQVHRRRLHQMDQLMVEGSACMDVLESSQSPLTKLTHVYSHVKDCASPSLLVGQSVICGEYVCVGLQLHHANPMHPEALS